jgi:hypothetical protein
MRPTSFNRFASFSNTVVSWQRKSVEVFQEKVARRAAPLLLQ